MIPGANSGPSISVTGLSSMIDEDIQKKSVVKEEDG